MTEPAETARVDAVNARCPRCGTAFGCGAIAAAAGTAAAAATPCACAGVVVPHELLARLRRDYRGCLCPGCLRAAARGDADLAAARGDLKRAADAAGSAPNARR